MELLGNDLRGEALGFHVGTLVEELQMLTLPSPRALPVETAPGIDLIKSSPNIMGRRSLR